MTSGTCSSSTSPSPGRRSGDLAIKDSTFSPHSPRGLQLIVFGPSRASLGCPNTNRLSSISVGAVAVIAKEPSSHHQPFEHHAESGEGRGKALLFCSLRQRSMAWWLAALAAETPCSTIPHTFMFTCFLSHHQHWRFPRGESM